MTRGFPIIIAEWPKNSLGEIIRVAIDRYNNRFTIDVRTWWPDRNGVFKPGRDGLTLAIQHLPTLAEHLGRALRRAHALGLVGADCERTRAISSTRKHRPSG